MARFSKLEFLLVFMLGIAIGATFTSLHKSTTGDMNRDKGPSKGMVKLLSETPVRNTVHVDDRGRPITKQQLLEPFVLPNLVGVSIATFLPGQTMMPPHEHESMHELFFVIEGSGIFEINGVQHDVSPGTFLHMAPKEKHGIWIPDDREGPLRVLVTGVTVGEKK